MLRNLFKKRLSNGVSLHSAEPRATYDGCRHVLDMSAKTVSTNKNSFGDVDLHDVATAVVSLYNLAPPLAHTAERMDAHAQEQAETVRNLARKTDAITQTLNAVTDGLESSVEEAFTSLKLIQEITNAAKILGINASIEAARAGEAGRPFAVLATEMQRLARQTEETSAHVTRTLQGMSEKVGEVVRVVGKTQPCTATSSSSEQNASTVAAITQAFHDIDSRAGQQQEEAHQVHELSEKTRSMSERLLLEVGKMRFELHAKSEAAVERIVRRPELKTGDRETVESLLIRAIQAFPFFDLLYLTDRSGRQIIRNIGHGFKDPASGIDALGNDWSQRPWFLHALNQEGLYTSDLYLSVTTNRFCFTVAQKIYDEDGEVVGVFGADVDFERLLKG